MIFLSETHDLNSGSRTWSWKVKICVRKLWSIFWKNKSLYFCFKQSVWFLNVVFGIHHVSCTRVFLKRNSFPINSLLFLLKIPQIRIGPSLPPEFSQFSLNVSMSWRMDMCMGFNIHFNIMFNLILVWMFSDPSIFQNLSSFYLTRLRLSPTYIGWFLVLVGMLH